MYKNYVFDLYGTLIDINTDEWCDDLWKKMALLYGYHGAHYTFEELNKEYDRLVELEKEKMHAKHPSYTVVDINIENVFNELFTLKKVKVSKEQILFIAEAFRCYSTKYIKLYDGVTDLLDTLKANGKRFIFCQTLSVRLLKMSLICLVLQNILTALSSARTRSAQSPTQIILKFCLTVTRLKKTSQL